MKWNLSGPLPVILIALAVVIAPVIAIFILDTFLDSPRKIGLAVGVLQGYVTVVAIGAGGAFAIYRFRIFRSLEPHITVSHTVSHRVVGDSYIHIFVTAMLHNGSKVEVEIREATFALQMIAPMTDFAVEAFSAEAFGDGEPNYIQWPTLHEELRSWDENEFIVEPSASHPESVEFIVSKEVKSILIDTYFYNRRYDSHSRSSQGWGVTTAYDIIWIK